MEDSESRDVFLFGEGGSPRKKTPLGKQNTVQVNLQEGSH